MKKIFRSKLFLILCAPILGIIGLWSSVAIFNDNGKATIPVILLFVGLFITASNAGWHILDKDINLKD